MAEPDLSDQITQNAMAPKTITIDGETVSEHSLPDLIAADQYNKANAANAAGGLPFRSVKLRPGSPADLPDRCL